MVRWINAGDLPGWLDIAAVERQWREKSGGDCRYLGDFTVGSKKSWSESPVAVFWQERPEQPEYSHYFGLYLNGGHVMICNALSAVKEPFHGILTPTGEVLFSRYRHDYRTSRDGLSFVDGGRDYFRRGGEGEHVLIHVEGYRFRVEAVA